MYRKLKRLARKYNVDVIINKDIDVGSFNNCCQVIVIPKHYNELKRIVTLAHEIGHVQQVRYWSDKKLSYYYKLYNDIITNKKKRYPVMLVEQGAWQRAKTILKSMGFRKWSYFNKYKHECLQDYYRFCLKKKRRK